MKINNYINVLSAVLITFGYSNNGYSAPAQAIATVPTSQTAYTHLVQGVKPAVQKAVNQVQGTAYTGVVQGTKQGQQLNNLNDVLTGNANNVGITQVTQLNTRDDLLKSDDSEVDKAFREKQNEVKKNLFNQYCYITAGMDKAFHFNKHKTQNNILKKYIQEIFLEFQFVHPACNAEFAKTYSDAVTDLKERLKKYDDGYKINLFIPEDGMR